MAKRLGHLPITTKAETSREMICEGICGIAIKILSLLDLVKTGSTVCMCVGKSDFDQIKGLYEGLKSDETFGVCFEMNIKITKGHQNISNKMAFFLGLRKNCKKKVVVLVNGGLYIFRK